MYRYDNVFVRASWRVRDGHRRGPFEDAALLQLLLRLLQLGGGDHLTGRQAEPLADGVLGDLRVADDLDLADLKLRQHGRVEYRPGIKKRPEVGNILSLQRTEVLSLN